MKRFNVHKQIDFYSTQDGWLFPRDIHKVKNVMSNSNHFTKFKWQFSSRTFCPGTHFPNRKTIFENFMKISWTRKKWIWDKLTLSKKISFRIFNRPIWMSYNKLPSPKIWSFFCFSVNVNSFMKWKSNKMKNVENESKCS